MTKKFDGNSIQNQDIKSKFVEKYIIYCQSSLVDNALSKGFFDYEDIENRYIDNTEEIEEIETEIENLEFTEGNDQKVNELYDKRDVLQEEQDEPQEIYEWWLVDNYLFNKLKDRGQPIIDNEYGQYWGRCTTGQAILLDNVITEICHEMGILEGQEYDWSK